MPAEINYEIHDKELLAIADFFKHWRRYLEGAKHQVQVFSDHQNLEYFTTTKVLNWQQGLMGTGARRHRLQNLLPPRIKKWEARCLSRWTEYRPEKGGDSDQLITTVLRKSHFASAISTREYWSNVTYIVGAARLATIPVREWHEEFVKLVKEKGSANPEYQKGLWEVERETREWEVAQRETEPNGRNAKEVAILPCEEQRMARNARSEGILGIKDRLLYRYGMLWIPEDRQLIRQLLASEHDSRVTGHMGQDKIIELVRQHFWWPKMNEQIIDYVRACAECQRNKAAQYHSYGLLSPLELPYTPWQSIAMDFITDLPLSEDCNQLWAVIDRFTKMVHFIHLPKDGKTASDLARIFVREVWWFHGLPSDIVSDRDSRFTSETWKEFLKLSGIRSQMSTAFHPETDGQTERLNQTIEAYLHSFVCHKQDDWVSLLPMAEFAYNNSVMSATGMSLFYANYGFHPTATNPAVVNILNPASKVYAHWMHSVHAQARKGLESAQERMCRYADPSRKEAPANQIGDLVMLNGQII